MKHKKNENEENNGQMNETTESPEMKDDNTGETMNDEKDVVTDSSGEWEEKYNEINDKYLRLYSEFDNFRRRTQKEKLELYKTAGEDIMLALLPVVDDFERAEKSVSDTTDVKSMKEGFKLIHHKLLNVLEQKGLKPMESSIGKDFDLERHEAITRIKAPSDDLKGKVADEVERGYMLNDKVIRFSKVVVGE